MNLILLQPDDAWISTDQVIRLTRIKMANFLK